MKYSKKFRKKRRIPRKKIFTNQKKKKYQKKTKRIKKGGSAADAAAEDTTMQWAPNGLELHTELSGAPISEVRENVRAVNNYLQEDCERRTDMNCVPLAVANTSGIRPVGNNTNATGLSKDELDNWIKNMPDVGTTIQDAASKGLHYMDYFRNISSRPHVIDPELGFAGYGEPANEKIWTDEPMIEFLNKLLLRGLSPKRSTRGFSAHHPNRTFDDGCIHVALYWPNSNIWHDVNVCRENGEIYIIDIQYKQDYKNKNMRGKIKGRELEQYLKSYSPNHFSIITEDRNKSVEHKNILENRLSSFSLNRQLYTSNGGHHVPLHQYALVEMMNLRQVISPSILSFPYNLHVNKSNKLMPFYINIDDNSLWPDTVKEKAQKYEMFQNNRYSSIIRQTALSAILNGENNVFLDYLFEIYQGEQVSGKVDPDATAAAELAVTNVLSDPESLPDQFNGLNLFEDYAQMPLGSPMRRAYIRWNELKKN